jgi:uncharacterized protein (DUF2236 family)
MNTQEEKIQAAAQDHATSLYNFDTHPAKGIRAKLSFIDGAVYGIEMEKERAKVLVDALEQYKFVPLPQGHSPTLYSAAAEALKKYEAQNEGINDN